MSSSTLRFVAGVIRAHRKKARVRWRRVTAGRQALMTLAYLHKGETYACLAVGFEVSVSTVFRRVNETISLVAARAPGLVKVLRRAKRRGVPYVILDGTLIHGDRVAVDHPYYSGKHRTDGVNVQAITAPDGDLLWTSGALPGSVHDTAAARIWRIPTYLRETGMPTLADKGYTGLDDQNIATPWKGRDKPGPKKTQNRTQARLRAPGERGFAELKKWRILRRLRCSTHRATIIVRAITVINHTG
ncbi:DDE superfamily endonuclease [Stackebrandtia soli]